MQNNVVKTAGRVFEVLEYFREVQRPLSVRQISEHCGYPLSSTSVLLKSLAVLGYLSYDQSLRAYFPTIRVASLGDWLFESMFNGQDLLGLVEEVAEATGETAILAVVNDIFAQYVHVVPSRRHPIQFHVPPGTRRVLCVSGCGWALLSRESDEAIARIYNKTAQKLGKSFRQMSLAEVMTQIVNTRKKGYAFSRGNITEGAGLIATPLSIAGSSAKLAIGVAGVLSRLENDEKRISGSLLQLADKYTRSAPQSRKA